MSRSPSFNRLVLIFSRKRIHALDKNYEIRGRTRKKIIHKRKIEARNIEQLARRLYQ